MKACTAANAQGSRKITSRALIHHRGRRKKPDSKKARKIFKLTPIPTNRKEFATADEYSRTATKSDGVYSLLRLCGSPAIVFIVAPITATVSQRTPLDAALLAALRQRRGDRLSTSPAVCEQHGKDESYHAPHAPDAVAFARSTEEVSAIVSLCAEYRTPVIAFGAGTSLEGHVAALAGGICLDLSQMNRILRINS